MFWRKILTAIAVAVFSVQFVTAEEHAAPPAGGQSEKPAEAGKKDPKDAGYSGVQSDEWAKAQKDVQTAKIKYENDKKAVDDLKHAAELQENLSKESLAKINEATKTMKASEANYLRLLNQYDMRFPEKGLDVGRKYERPDAERDGIETVEEKPQGVEAKLRRLNRNIKRQYLTTEDANSASGSVKKKQPKKQSSGESEETLPQTQPGDVTGTIKIEK